MHTTTAAPSTAPQYRLQYWRTGQSIRLHCNPAAAGTAPQIVAQRCTPERASRFGSVEAALRVAETYLPNELLHAVPVDA